MLNLWNELHTLFASDDRLLPEIWLTNLSADEVETIYMYLRDRAAPISLDATFWDNTLQQNRPLVQVPNVVQRMGKGQAECFHFVLASLTHQMITIPDLGVFVFPDEIALDYRPGRDWSAATIEALFRVLYDLHQLAPDTRIRLWDVAIPSVQQHFLSVVHDYFIERSQAYGR